MKDDWSNPSPDPVSDPGTAIEDVVDGLAQLSRDELSPAQFLRELVTQAIQTLAARGAAVWKQAADGSFIREQELAVGVEWPPIDPPWHALLLTETLAAGQSRLVPPDHGSPGAQAKNPGPNLLLLNPWSVDSQMQGVLEIVLRPEADPAAWQGYAQFGGALAELIADFHRQRHRPKYLPNCQHLFQPFHQSKGR